MIIGFGEIGNAVRAVTGDTAILDLNFQENLVEDVDIMHICFPYSEDFIAQVNHYIQEWMPKHIVIWSTLPIGITKQIPKAVHSPVEGKHPDLEMSIRMMERWIGANDHDEALFFHDYFVNLGLRTRTVSNSDYTEALKLLSTTEYGVNIVFAAYKARVAEAIGMDYELTKEWNRAYNRLYKDLGMEKRFQKFVLDAPKGKIGGHCVRQNTYLLENQFPDNILNMIQDLDV